MLPRCRLMAISIVICMAGFGSTFAEPTTRPSLQEPASKPAASPSSQPESMGAIPEAMKHLFTLHRPNGREGGPAVKTEMPRRPAERSTSGGARRVSAPSGATEDDLRYAFPNGTPFAATRPADGQAAAPRYAAPDPDAYPPTPYASSPYGPDGYGPYVFPPTPGGAAAEAYQFGFLKAYRYGQFIDESNIRTQAVLKHYKGHLSEGLTLFNQGKYHEAADAFRLAAETHQGDPAARLYSAHALFAIGHYHDAIPYLRRAFELQPKIVYLRFDIHEDYGKPGDCDRQIAALEKALEASPANTDRLILLGYIRYFGGQRERAYAVLHTAWRMDRRDTLVSALIDNCRPADVVLEEAAKRR